MGRIELESIVGETCSQCKLTIIQTSRFGTMHVLFHSFASEIRRMERCIQATGASNRNRCSFYRRWHTFPSPTQDVHAFHGMHARFPNQRNGKEVSGRKQASFHLVCFRLERISNRNRSVRFVGFESHGLVSTFGLDRFRRNTCVTSNERDRNGPSKD